MFPHLPTHLPPLLRSPRNIVVLGFGLAVISGVTSYVLTRRRPSAEEIERERRDTLAVNGRITDGSITATQWLVPAEARPAGHQAEAAPDVGSMLSLGHAAVRETVALESLDTPGILVYRYVIAGVTYECAQDVSTLAEYVRHVRVDLPIQVRFDPRNPGNSIVVAEAWSGPRLNPGNPAADYRAIEQE